MQRASVHRARLRFFLEGCHRAANYDTITHPQWVSRQGMLLKMTFHWTKKTLAWHHRVPKEGLIKSRSQSRRQRLEHKHLHNQFHLSICFWLIWRPRVKAADLRVTFSRVVPSPSPAKILKAFTISTWQHLAATKPGHSELFLSSVLAHCEELQVDFKLHFKETKESWT